MSVQRRSVTDAGPAALAAACASSGATTAFQDCLRAAANACKTLVMELRDVQFSRDFTNLSKFAGLTELVTSLN
jgi:hypothetical protein